MKTNLINLMSLVKEEEAKLKDNCYLLGIYKENKNTIEVKEPFHREELENHSKKFKDIYNEILDLEMEIAKNKSIIFEKNNSLKLPNGDTIQKTLNIINNKKMILKSLESIKDTKTKKERVTEVNNSYYVETTPSFDVEEINTKINYLKVEILDLEFEISKLNSQEFEI